MRMSFANHNLFDPPLDLTVSSQPNGIPSMFTCFDYKPARSVPEGRDCVVIVGRRNHGAIVEHIAERARRAVVIACPGDKPFNNQGRPIPDNVVRVFTTNRMHADPRVISIPIGVRTSKLQQIRYARRHRPEGSHRSRALLYANFTTGSVYEIPAERRGLSSRRAIAARLRNEDWVTDRTSEEAVKGEDALFRYFTEVMQHRFVASPEGVGMDCYRHWESLYLGAIPIVQRSPHMDAFSDLPILYTDDFTELSKAYLEDTYERFSSRTFDFSKLYAPYYTGMLIDAVNQLDDPAFVLLLSDEEKSGLWPARDHLMRLSRHDGPYRDGDLLQAGNLIPASEHDRRRWRAKNGAQISFDGNGGIIVEHASDCELVGATLDLPTVRGVTYRIHGAIRRTGDETNLRPKLLVTAAQSRKLIYAQAAGEYQETNINLTFTSVKTGSHLEFRPGRGAILKIEIEPEIERLAQSKAPDVGRAAPDPSDGVPG
jgi:hypothetical protein